MVCNGDYFVCNPFFSRCSIIERAIDIHPCENIINDEFTIDFCPRLKRRMYIYNRLPIINCNNRVNICRRCNNNSCSKRVKINCCEPYTEKTIDATLEDLILVHIKINLLHIRCNRNLKLAVILYNNNVPYAFKVQNIDVASAFKYDKINRGYCKCACTTVDYDFIMTDSIISNQLQMKVISQYEW